MHPVINLFSLSLLVLIVCPLIGVSGVPYRALISAQHGQDALILWQLRVPRVLLAYLVGAGLSLSGVVFQAMLRNLLASPFTLGVSGGAAFGISLYAHLGFAGGVISLLGRIGFGFLGALLSILLVFLAACGSRNRSAATLLLAGVVLSFFFSSMVLLIQYLSDPAQVFLISRWLMGSVDTVGYNEVLIMSVFLGLGSAVVLFFRRELNLLSVGDDFAASRGVSVWHARAVLYGVVSLVVGVTVSLCGVVGFVGIVVPYLCRFMVGENHEVLIPSSFLFGGVFLTLCDSLSRIVLSPVELPVGVITALLGAPFFLWLLLREGRRPS